MNMEGEAGRAGYCPGAQRRSAGRCSFRHGKSRAADEGIFTEEKATGENLLEKHEHGKAKQGAQGIVQGRNAEAQAGAASDTGKSGACGEEIFTEGKRQMNRRGNLRRRESTGRNVSEKHEHGRRSEARRVSSGGATQKRRPVQPPTQEKAGRPAREPSQRGKRQMNRRGNLRRRESTGRNVSEKHEHGRQSEVHRVLSGGATQKCRPVQPPIWEKPGGRRGNLHKGGSAR